MRKGLHQYRKLQKEYGRKLLVDHSPFYVSSDNSSIKVMSAKISSNGIITITLERPIISNALIIKTNDTIN